MSRPAAAVDLSGAAPEMADQRQADYFLRLLTENRRLIDYRVDGYHKVIAMAEADGDVEGACGFRRLARIDEQDRQTLDGLIKNLRRRFLLGGPGQVSAIPRRAPLAVR
jgi:hypothetical protein